MEVGDWSVREVCSWLSASGFDLNIPTFREQQISGIDLMELTEGDLVELGFSTVGIRKRFQRKLADLVKYKSRDEFIEEEFDNSSSHSSNISTSDQDSQSSQSSLSTGSTTDKKTKKTQKLKCKCYYHKDIRVISIDPQRVTYKKLQQKIKDEYNRTLNIFWKDEEGDKIKIGSDRQLKTALRTINPESSDSSLKLILERKSKTSKRENKTFKNSDDVEFESAFTENQLSLFDTLTEGVIITTVDGYIQFFNKASEKIFGYGKNEVIGKPVKMLMPAMYAARHDDYIRNYLRTGKSKIIGTARQVLGIRKDGSSFGFKLSLSENKTPSSHTFTGVIKVTETEVRNASEPVSQQQQLQLLDKLLDIVIAIDQNGNILHANPKAAEFFQYELAHLVGSNISMLMPNPHRDNHNHYMSRYLKTGKSTVIGKTRDTICELADGTIVPISLSVTESTHNGSKTFIGTISTRKASQRAVSFLVQQRQVIETLATPAIIIDSNGIIQAFNQTALKTLRYSLEEVLGNNVSMIVGGGLAERHNSYIQNYLQTRVPKIIGKDRVVFARTKQGVEIEILLTVTEHVDSGKSYFIGMFFNKN